ncbi:MAG: hypothetical protein ACJ71T_01180 [Actinomycetales bacterium]
MRAGQRVLVLIACLVGLAVCVAGCGRSAVPGGAGDYTKNQALNTKAQLVAGPLGAALGDDPTYGGMRIVPQGIEFDVVGRASPALSSAIAQTNQTVPVQTRTVTHSWRALQGLTAQLNEDQPTWRTKGLLLTMWGPDVSTNRVKIWLSKYDSAAASILTKTYGAAWIVVSPESETGSGS